MRLQVKVPVLSTQSTVVAPSASTACGWRVSTFSRARRQAPSASITVQTTANSSGMIAMASVNPTRSPAVHDPSRQAKTLAANTQVITARKATARTRRTSCSCKRLGRGSIDASTPPIRPSVVRIPVASTTAAPSPWTISVPARSTSGIAFAKGDALVDRHRFAGEERLVDPQAVRFEQPGVAGHAVAFLDDQVIANHQFLAGDATHHAPAHHGAARARQIAQRLQDALSAQLLVHRDNCDSRRSRAPRTTLSPMLPSTA